MAELADFDLKTEQPTQRRRREVRERGSVARSGDLNTATSMLAASAMLYFFGSGLTEALAEILRKALSAAPRTHLELETVSTQIWGLVPVLAGAVLPGLALLVVAAVGVGAAQAGFLATTEPLFPSLGRINPFSGAARLVSLANAVRLAGSVLKLTVLLAIVAGFVTGQLAVFLKSVDLGTAAFCRQVGTGLVSLAFQMAVGLIVLALLDYGFQLWTFEQEIKMTKQELRDELRHMEGDPQIRQRRHEAHRKLLGSLTARQAKDANVVITGTGGIAVAIKSDAAQLAAPIVLASGEGRDAEVIRKAAADEAVPFVENPSLAQALLRRSRPGQPIPSEFFDDIAEILAIVNAGKPQRRALAAPIG